MYSIIILDAQDSSYEELRDEILGSLGPSQFIVTRKETLQEGIDLITNYPFDAILLSSSLPDATVLEAVRQIRVRDKLTPILLLIDAGIDELDALLLKEGVQDIITRGEYPGILPKSIIYAIQRQITIIEAHKAQQEAFKFARAKGEFLANMSHEMRTPLTSILGYAKLLYQPLSPADESLAKNAIITNGNQLLRVINDVLEFSAVEIGKFSITKEYVSVEKILNALYATFSHKAMQSGIRLSFQVCPPLPKKIYTDYYRLSQVLNNLLENACKFSNLGMVHVLIHHHSSVLTIDVIDNGIGIPKDQIDKLFKPFSQVDSSTTRRFGGTGLGLKISSEVAVLLGGGIVLESKEDVGSSFKLTIDSGFKDGDELIYLVNDLENASFETSEEGACNFNLKVIFADDCRDNRQLIEMMLRNLGCRVILAIDGNDAIDKLIANEDADLLLLDLQMPEMDGFQILEVLRGFNQKLPVAILSASVLNETKERCFAMGANFFLNKPFQDEEFVETLDAIYRSKHGKSFRARVVAVDEVVVTAVDRSGEPLLRDREILASQNLKINELERAIRERNLEKIAFLGHKLVSLGFLSLHKIANMASTIELLARQWMRNDLSIIEDIFEQLMAEWQAVYTDDSVAINGKVTAATDCEESCLADPSSSIDKPEMSSVDGSQEETDSEQEKSASEYMPLIDQVERIKVESLKILLLESDVDDLGVTKKILQSAGFHVDGEPNPYKIPSRLAVEQYEVFIVDSYADKFTIKNLISTLRGNYKIPRVPPIIVIADEGSELEESMPPEMNMVDVYVYRPISKHSIVCSILASVNNHIFSIRGIANR